MLNSSNAAPWNLLILGPALANSALASTGNQFGQFLLEANLDPTTVDGLDLELGFIAPLASTELGAIGIDTMGAVRAAAVAQPAALSETLSTSTEVVSTSSDTINSFLAETDSPPGSGATRSGSSPSCTSPDILCGSYGCVDPTTDPLNCGSCDTTCTSDCNDGTCDTSDPCTNAALPDSCPSGCVNLSNDPMNCGQCGNACAAGLICQQESCVTPVSASNYDGNYEGYLVGTDACGTAMFQTSRQACFSLSGGSVNGGMLLGATLSGSTGSVLTTTGYASVMLGTLDDPLETISCTLTGDIVLSSSSPVSASGAYSCTITSTVGPDCSSAGGWSFVPMASCVSP
jgi:hypothetical protein